MIARIVLGVIVLIVFFITWVLMRSASITDRQFEELARRKFFGEGGNSSEL